MAHARPMLNGRPISVLLLVLVAGCFPACQKRPVPDAFVGTYVRSGDAPEMLRAELSLARGGIVLTVFKMSASADTGIFGRLFSSGDSVSGSSGGSARISGSAGRTAARVGAFRTVDCTETRCEFELEKATGFDACKGSFDRVGRGIVVVATGSCEMFSGRWLAVDALSAPPSSTVAPPAPTPTTTSTAGGHSARTETPPVPNPPPSTAAPPVLAPSTAPTASIPSTAPGRSMGALQFPPDIPAPKDHMSCLRACSIMNTRCHQACNGPNMTCFLGCVESHELCRARCEEVFPFFGK